MTIIGKPYQFHDKCKTDMEEKGNWNQFHIWENKGSGKYSVIRYLRILMSKWERKLWYITYYGQNSYLLQNHRRRIKLYKIILDEMDYTLYCIKKTM